MSLRYLRSARDVLIIAIGTMLAASCGGGSSPPAQYTIGVAVEGLVGSGLVLQDNGGNDLAVAANGNLVFPAPVSSGSAYAVTVKTQPTGPLQTCVVANAAGTVGSANVANVAVTCTTNTYTVGGSVGGLVGSGLVLQDNGGNDLTIAANGSFVFSAAVASASAYAVTIKTQPTGPLQTCVVANAAGTVGSANVANVAVTCTTNTYTVGGSVAGLVGAGLALQDNGGNDLAVAANGNFVFSVAVASGSAYAVTTKTQPTSPSQTCVVANAAGTVGGANVANVAVTCTTNTYTVGGSVAGLAGAGLVLQDSGGNDLAVPTNGNFVFSAAVASGSAFAVTIKLQPTSPSQTCVGANATGIVGGANVANVAITCTTNTYTVGGAVGGLIGSGLVLQDNGGNDLAVTANGNFVFSTAVASASAYAVTIKTQPTTPSQTCVTANAAGTIGAANVADIALTCTLQPGRFAYVASRAIDCYAVNAVTGALAALAGSPCDSAATSGIAVDPSGRFAYATLNSSNEVRAYLINNSTGALTAIVGSQLNGGGTNPVDVVVDPLGQFVYMANYGGSISAFKIDSVTGGLTAVPGSPFPTAPAIISGQPPGANSVTVDPTGKFLYAAINQGNDLSAYLIDSNTGALTPISGSPFSAGNVPMTVRVDPSGRYAYATNLHSNNISAYSIDSGTGALTPIAGSPFSSADLASPTGVAIDPSGGFIYVTNSNSNTVSAFSINSSTGVLTPISGSPFASGVGSYAVTAHPSGKFLYVSAGGNVSAFAIDSASGALTPISGSPFAAPGNGTYTIAISY
jgi:6-phosphogluconolactonase (cycloisomerase 2 family)